MSTNKRKRIDDIVHGEKLAVDSEEVTPSYGRGEIWYDDGNIVLIAENVGFRVYKGILCENSEIFRDMFAMPQPTDAEMWDACPVVHVTDSSEDFSHIMSALFKLEFRFKQSLPFTAVSAMLRLGSKYQLEHLRVDAVNRLEHYFPTNLNDFTNHLTTMVVESDNAEKFLDEGIQLKGQDAIAVIDLATTYNLPRLLPSAFYIVANLSYDLLVNGYEDANGVHWSLTAGDLIRCLDGQSTLRKRVIEQQKCLLVGQSSSCWDGKRCSKTLIAQREPLLSSLHANARALRGPDWIKRTGVCIPCQGAFTDAHSLQRKRVWAELTEIFGLDNKVVPDAEG